MQIAEVALTDLNVQFSTDAEGHSQMVTTRIPHGTKNWNPFIEPSDAIQHSNGKLSQVLCKDDKLTGFLLTTSNGAVKLDVTDPSRVLMRNSPNGFIVVLPRPTGWLPTMRWSSPLGKPGIFCAV